MSVIAQQTITWDYDGIARKYKQYVPSSYDGSTAVPLVIALHGLGDNINNFQGVGFQVVADTAGFITIYP
jgi:polyhydroxybutyrate depolymerase